MPAGVTALAVAIALPRATDEDHRLLGGEHPGRGGRGDLADGVAGEDPHAAQARRLVVQERLQGDEAGADDEGLGDGRGPDRRLVRGRAVGDEVDVRRGGQPLEAVTEAGEVEPGGEEAGLWEPCPGQTMASTCPAFTRTDVHRGLGDDKNAPTL